MASYKLIYFDIRGRGELARYVLKAAGRDFEDKRIPREEWPAFKPSTPFGQMPILEVDGKKLAQSNTIARFLANEFGLGGKTNWERAQIDQIIDLIIDLRTELIKVFFEQDEEKKAELQKKMQEEIFPKFLGIFEKLLEHNGGKYFVGKSLTLADLAILDALDTPIQNNADLLKPFSTLASHRQMICELPRLQDYINNRKATQF